ncbi:MAG: saccharopine dehydrogenase NADP-binding domain-containing protein, partial [Synergistaceae bacterium]
MKAVQIGAGLVGSIIASDMSTSFDVTVVDLNENALSLIREDHPKITTAVCSCTDPVCLSPLIRDADVVTAGVPGKFGRKMME